MSTAGATNESTAKGAVSEPSDGDVHCQNGTNQLSANSVPMAGNHRGTVQHSIQARPIHTYANQASTYVPKVSAARNSSGPQPPAPPMAARQLKTPIAGGTTPTSAPKAETPVATANMVARVAGESMSSMLRWGLMDHLLRPNVFSTTPQRSYQQAHVATCTRCGHMPPRMWLRVGDAIR